MTFIAPSRPRSRSSNIGPTLWPMCPTRDLRFFIPAMRQDWDSRFASVTRADLRKLLNRIEASGPLTIRDIDDDVLVEKSHAWDSKKPSKHALQLAFYKGLLTISARERHAEKLRAGKPSLRLGQASEARNGTRDPQLHAGPGAAHARVRQPPIHLPSRCETKTRDAPRDRGSAEVQGACGLSHSKALASWSTGPPRRCFKHLTSSETNSYIFSRRSIRSSSSASASHWCSATIIVSRLMFRRQSGYSAISRFPS